MAKQAMVLHRRPCLSRVCTERIEPAPTLERRPTRDDRLPADRVDTRPVQNERAPPRRERGASPPVSERRHDHHLTLQPRRPSGHTIVFAPEPAESEIVIAPDIVLRAVA